MRVRVQRRGDGIGNGLDTNELTNKLTNERAVRGRQSAFRGANALRLGSSPSTGRRRSSGRRQRQCRVPRASAPPSLRRCDTGAGYGPALGGTDRCPPDPVRSAAAAGPLIRSPLDQLTQIRRPDHRSGLRRLYGVFLYPAGRASVKGSRHGGTAAWRRPSARPTAQRLLKLARRVVKIVLVRPPERGGAAEREERKG